ncbi:FAD binding domain-containing protein [Streptomyces griseoruber]
MKPAAFEYHAPVDPEETVTLLARLGDEAKVLAGGQSLVPMLALRLAAFGHLVDLRRVKGLPGIEHRGGVVRIGATTTQAAVERSDVVRDAAPLLARATPLIGHFQIRSRGTVGGSLAHADAAAEYPAVALTLDARLETLSPRGRRTVPADRFFTGTWSTDLAEDELLTAVALPVWHRPRGFAVAEFARRSGDFALAGATVAVGLGPDRRIDRCAIAVFGLGPVPCRARAAERELIGREPTTEAAGDIADLAVSGLDSVPADLHGSAGYRKRVGAAMVARAWRHAVREAVHD